MAWYKLTCQHGPGHQSRAEKFVEVLNRRDVDGILREWVDEEVQWHEQAKGEAVRVKRFTKAEKAKLLDDLRHKADLYRMMVIITEQQIERLIAREC